jgi:hypothetical protein
MFVIPMSYDGDPLVTCVAFVLVAIAAVAFRRQLSG